MRSTADRRTAKDLAVVWLAVVIVSLFSAAGASAIVLSAGDAGDAAHQAGPEPARLPAGSPVRVRIPAIGVDAGLDGLGISGDGALEVPPYDRAGWYEGGPKPGEIGRSVIAAHVDSTVGPAVFYQLKVLRAGDAVIVDYDDGTSVEFVVRGADTFAKSEFPTERIYGPTEVPALGLITCAGDFDRRTRSYRENLVVWTEARATPPSAL